MTEPGDVALAAEGIFKKFTSGKREAVALKGVSMQVRRGLVTGLIGPDGAGKTTLMRIAAGLLTPDKGNISVLGIDVARRPLQVQSSIGYMPQRFGLYEDLSVQENLDLYADLKGVATNDRPARYRELMTMTGLGPFLRRLAGRLSGGMKQKLGLACTLVNPPQFLILDEPTVGVDPVSRRELWSIVYRLVRDEGMSVLMSTAYLDEADRCDDLFLLHEGRILGSGPPKSFSGPMEDRTYRVRVPSVKNRILQERLSGRPGVVDALVQGEAVRLVMKDAGLKEAEKLMSGMDGASIEPVPPRFEDSFISLLREDRPSVQSSGDAGKMTSEAARDNGETVIEVKDLQRRFGDFYAVKRITFEVRRGEVFGLLGANGAGKSTTFRMLCGLLPPSGGRLSVAGVDLRRAAASARGRIGYMSQRFSLYGNLSVRQNLDFFSSAYGLSGRHRSEKVEWALTQFELSAVSGSTSADLPLGFKQRLAMACALMHEPDIIFLDEPTSGVDPLARREFWRRIDALAERGVTVLVTTHFMEEAEYCDRLAIMAAGEILAIGSPSEIKSLARTKDLPEPTLEDAFISLITGKTEGAAA